MRYRSLDDPGDVEEVWNSRDGITPYTILMRSGSTGTHADWATMVPRPDYQPPAGSRVFVDLTPEIARANAGAYVKRIWDDQGAEGMLARQDYKSADDMLAALISDIKPGEPALVEVPEEGWKP
jgi:hypothetical protein